MSQGERDWLEWLKRAQDGVVTQRQAAEKMGVSDRWVRNLLVPMKTEGDAVVVHGLRGRASNRRIDVPTQARAIELLKQPEWHDFGPTFASEQLAKRHNIQASKETMRGWMVKAGCGRRKRPTQGSAPVAAAAERIWRVGAMGHVKPRLAGRQRRSVRYLVRMIDDATSRSEGRFVQHDGTRENMGVLWQYVERKGRMVDVYTDRAAMFMVTPRAGENARQRQAADPVDANRPRPARTGNRMDRGVLAPSQGASGAQLWRGPGSFSEASASGRGEDHARRQPIPGRGVLAGVERAFRAPADWDGGHASCAYEEWGEFSVFQ
jgi:hypothetical protein